MSLLAALPMGVELQPQQAAATFLVPAQDGCNLNCPFCVVKARSEGGTPQTQLSIEDYCTFLCGLHGKLHIGYVSIVGHEPLLTASFPYTEAILKTAHELNLPTALITNGTYLEHHASELEKLDLSGVSISLDSSVPGTHDTLKRTTGAYEKTMRGLSSILETSLRSKVFVASVLYPGKRSYLESMPELLFRLGVKNWTVSPLMVFSGDELARTGEKHETIINDLIYLYERAYSFGIELVTDAEFDEQMRTRSKIYRIGTPRCKNAKKIDQAFRLSPMGAFSIGSEVLKKIGPDIPVWEPSAEHVNSFLTRCFSGQLHKVHNFLR